LKVTFKLNCFEWLPFDKATEHLEVGSLVVIRDSMGDYTGGIVEAFADGRDGPRIILDCVDDPVYGACIDAIAILPKPEDKRLLIEVDPVAAITWREQQ